MYTTEELEDLRKNPASRAAAEAADTTITINNTPRNIPAPPVLQAPIRPSPAPSPEPVIAGGQPVSVTRSHKVATAPAPTITSRQTSTSRNVNWGNVVKGVVAVTAVVAVAVVAYYAIPSLVSGFLTGLGSESVLAAGINWTVGAVSTAVAAIGSVAMAGIHMAAGFLGYAATALFGSSAATGAAAAAGTGITAASSAAVGHAAGALAAGGVLAVGAPLAAKAITAAPLLDMVHHHTATITPITGVDDTSIGAGHHHTSTYPDPFRANLDMPDVPDEALAQQQTTIKSKLAMQHLSDAAHAQELQMKTASKIAHHAMHGAEHNAADGNTGATDMPELPEYKYRNASKALGHSMQSSEAWAQRAASEKTGYSKALQEGASHSEAVRAARPERDNTPTQRHSQFATELNDERAALDAALGQAAR